MDNQDNAARPADHVWKFFRAGGFCQIRLDSGQDLAALGQLDQKLWVALSCPVNGLELDAKTLELIDTDKDGRIRVPEILGAVSWACGLLKNPEVLLESAASLPLAAISDATPEGERVLHSARHILDNLGKKDAQRIGVEDTTSTERIFAQTLFNGDGIITPESAEGATQAVIADILACLGGETDRSGKPGISQPKADQFFAEAQAFSDWWLAAEQNAAAVLPLGNDTLQAAEVLGAVKGKIDDYFVRCRLAAFDARALVALNRQESEYLAIAAKDLTITAAEVAGFPLARIEAGKPLPLSVGINPAWADAIARLRDQVVRPLLGEKDAITESDWSGITAKFARLGGWMAAKPKTVVEKLGLPRVREVLSGGHKETIAALIGKDKALEPEANAIAAVDKLVRLNRDLYRLLNNFVAFRDFYGRRELAAFQAGRLYLDQRACDLCIRVLDVAKHVAIAHMSGMYLAYCDVTRPGSKERMTIVAAFTAGDSDNLMVGRNGVFYDRKGRDWDATIVRIVDNPISFQQAFWAPYKRVIRWVEDQVAKHAATADAAATSQMTAAATLAGKPPPTAKPAETKPRFDVGVVAALGVAVGGLTAAMGVLVQAFFGLGLWMPAGVIGLVLLISGPSMLIAYLKLRQRNLGPLLDATGWAVNSKAKINIPFGRSLTSTAKLPLGAIADLVDPFAVKRHWKPQAVAAILLVPLFWALWFFGGFEKVLPGRLPQSSWVRHGQAAACPNPSPAAASPAAKPDQTPASKSTATPPAESMPTSGPAK